MRKLFLILMILIISPLFSQEAAAETEKTYESLPDGFNRILLGLSMEQTKAILKNEDNFHYRGDPDVSLQSRPNESSLDVEGLGYVYRGIFQYYQDTLYIIIIMIDPEKMDHYSIFTHLTEKYGPPEQFSPDKSVWRQDGKMLVLERPVTLKYIDEGLFTQLVGESETEKSLESELREEFINQF